MIARFPATGEDAAATKRSKEFKIPLKKAVREMNSKKGNMIRVNSIVYIKRSGVFESPGYKRLINWGKNSSTNKIKMARVMAKMEKIFWANSRASFLPRLVKMEEKIGIKEALKAPSAKIRRKTLGIRIASLRASFIAPAPK